jgi:Mor family transcriptional regulator
MPTLVRLLEFIESRADLPENLSVEIRREFAGERVYIPPPGSRKDPERKEKIKKAAAKLPTRVVADMYGVSPQWVYQVIKSK